MEEKNVGLIGIIQFGEQTVLMQYFALTTTGVTRRHSLLLPTIPIIRDGRKKLCAPKERLLKGFRQDLGYKEALIWDLMVSVLIANHFLNIYQPLYQKA